METKMTLIEIVRQFRILPAPETKVRTSLLDSQYTHTHTHTDPFLFSYPFGWKAGPKFSLGSAM